MKGLVVLAFPPELFWAKRGLVDEELEVKGLGLASLGGMSTSILVLGIGWVLEGVAHDYVSA